MNHKFLVTYSFTHVKTTRTEIFYKNLNLESEYLIWKKEIYDAVSDVVDGVGELVILFMKELY